MATATLVRGDQLTARARRQVLAAFVHRNTVEHPFPASGGQPVTDAEWLASKAFYVKADGSLDARYGHAEPAVLAQ